jgi:hypothetical protein
MARTHLVSDFRRGFCWGFRRSFPRGLRRGLRRSFPRGIASRHHATSSLSGRLAWERGMFFRGSELQLRHNVGPSMGALAPEESMVDFPRTLVRFSKTSAQ